MSDSSEQSSSGTTAKVAGGIGAGLLALIVGIGKHADDAARTVGHKGGAVIRHGDDLGRVAPHLDDVGRGGAHVDDLGRIPGDRVPLPPGATRWLDDAGQATHGWTGTGSRVSSPSHELVHGDKPIEEILEELTTEGVRQAPGLTTDREKKGDR